MHPAWGGFFLIFGKGGLLVRGKNYASELAVGEKFIEGRQTMFYEVQVKWIDPD